MTTVNVWDKDYNLVDTIDGGWRLDEPGVITLPLSDPTAQWIAEEGPKEAGVYMTAHYADSRFSGRLAEFKIAQAPFNARVNVKYLKAEFVEDVPAEVVDWNKLVDAQ